METPNTRTTTTVTGAGGAAALVLVWALGLAGVVIPAEVAAAAVLVLGWLAGYILPPRPPSGGGAHAAN